MTVMRNILSKYHIDEDDVGAGCLNTRSVEGPSCKWPLCLLPSGRHSQSTLRFASNLARHFLNEHGRDVDSDGDEDDIDDDDLDDQAVTLNPCYASHRTSIVTLNIAMKMMVTMTMKMTMMVTTTMTIRPSLSIHVTLCIELQSSLSYWIYPWWWHGWWWWWRWRSGGHFQSMLRFAPSWR